MKTSVELLRRFRDTAVVFLHFSRQALSSSAILACPAIPAHSLIRRSHLEDLCLEMMTKEPDKYEKQVGKRRENDGKARATAAIRCLVRMVGEATSGGRGSVRRR